MLVRTTTRNPAVLSYYTMRKAVGLIALILPFALAVGCILYALIGPYHALPQPILQRSVSDYYYTPMRNYLVGSLCAIAAFLACSRGYDLTDEIAGYLASFFTLCVALIPPVDPRSSSLHGDASRDRLRAQRFRRTHASLAGLFLYFSLSQVFTGKDADPPQAAQKQGLRNLRSDHRSLHRRYGQPDDQGHSRIASTFLSALLVRVAGAGCLRCSLAYQGRRNLAGQATGPYPIFVS